MCAAVGVPPAVRDPGRDGDHVIRTTVIMIITVIV